MGDVWLLSPDTAGQCCDCSQRMSPCDSCSFVGNCCMTLPTLVIDDNVSPYANLVTAQSALSSSTSNCLIQINGNMSSHTASVSSDVLSINLINTNHSTSVSSTNSFFSFHCANSSSLNIDFSLVASQTMNVLTINFQLYDGNWNSISTTSRNTSSNTTLSGSVNIDVPNKGQFYIRLTASAFLSIFSSSFSQTTSISGSGDTISFCTIRAGYVDPDNPDNILYIYPNSCSPCVDNVIALECRTKGSGGSAVFCGFTASNGKKYRTYTSGGSYSVCQQGATSPDNPTPCTNSEEFNVAFCGDTLAVKSEGTLTCTHDTITCAITTNNSIVQSRLPSPGCNFNHVCGDWIIEGTPSITCSDDMSFSFDCSRYFDTESSSDISVSCAGKGCVIDSVIVGVENIYFSDGGFSASLSDEDTIDDATNRFDNNNPWGDWLVNSSCVAVFATPVNSNPFKFTPVQWRVNLKGYRPTITYDISVDIYRKVDGSTDPWTLYQTVTIQATADIFGNLISDPDDVPNDEGFDTYVDNDSVIIIVHH